MKTIAPSTLASNLVTEPYAWPGGYPRYAITDDGGCLCKQCCADEHARIKIASPKDGFYIVGIDINWEDDNLYCDHCNAAIESAYGE
jgi:hypothetical protein